MSKNWRFQDLSGQNFGNLTVIKLSEKKGKNYYWECLCECGTAKNVLASSLKCGETKSCGCLRRKIVSENNISHGLTHHALYQVWNSMKERCYNENNKRFDDYGKRCITVCDEWRNHFTIFYAWAMANGYEEGLELDREQNNGNYEPGNCRFVTRRINANNKRSNLLFEIDGSKLRSIDLEKRYGIPSKIIVQRINIYGWTVERAIATPVLKRNRI